MPRTAPKQVSPSPREPRRASGEKTRVPLRSGRPWGWFAVCGTLAILGSCAESSSPAQIDDGAFRVLTTFYPTEYFVQRIGGDAIEVRCLASPEDDPLFWKPGRDDVADMQAASLLVLNGNGLETWLDQVSLPESRLVDTGAPLIDDVIHYENAVTHQHGDGEEHTHEGMDCHTWLDPKNALAQSRVLFEALSRSLPERSQEFATNFESLEKDLQRIHESLDALEPGPLLASHPAYNYLARRYDWQVTNFDLDPDSDLSDEQIEELVQAQRDTDAKVVLWESAPTAATRTRLEQQGLTSVVFSPCETSSGSMNLDFRAVMENNVSRLHDALTQGAQR